MCNHNFTENHNLLKNINIFLPNCEKKWTNTNNCQSCRSLFGNIFNKRHHCRCCGRCYCWECCHIEIQIPTDIIDIPQEETTYSSYTKSVLNYFEKNKSKKKLVCNNCHSKLLILNKIKNYINILYFCDIKTIYNCLCVSKNMNYAATYILFKFKNSHFIINSEISYKTWERNFFLNNFSLFSGHNYLAKFLVKIFIFNCYNNINSFSLEDIIFVLKNNNKKTKCYDLLCNPMCQKDLNLYDLIEIFDYIMFCEEKYTKMFWNNNILKILIKNIILRISESYIDIEINNLQNIFFIFLGKFLTNSDNIKDNFDMFLIFDLFDLLKINSIKIPHILTNNT